MRLQALHLLVCCFIPVQDSQFGQNLQVRFERDLVVNSKESHQSRHFCAAYCCRKCIQCSYHAFPSSVVAPADIVDSYSTVPAAELEEVGAVPVLVARHLEAPLDRLDGG